MKTRELVRDYLSERNKNDLRYLHNAYCEAIGNYDDMIYENENDFWELVSGGDHNETARKIYYGDYRYMDAYIRLNGYGNVETISEYSLEQWVDIDEIADYIVENDDDLEDEDIRDILDEFDECDDEDNNE